MSFDVSAEREFRLIHLMRRFLMIALLSVASASAAFGSSLASPSDVSDWRRFSIQVEETTQQQRFEGLAYMVSGGLVLIGSTIGLEKSDDILAKSVYSISQTLSIAAIGYGAYLHSIGDEDRTFFNIIENSTSLSPTQKNEILLSYQRQRGENKRKARLIRIITHGLIAAANFYGASQESDEGLRTALYFMGGVNAIASISIAF